MHCVDPDQMPQNAVSDQGLHYLLLMQHYSRLSQIDFFPNFRTNLVRS